MGDKYLLEQNYPGMKSNALVDVLKAFDDVYEALMRVVELFYTPEMILQSVEGERKRVSSADFYKASMRVQSSFKNLERIMLNFKSEIMDNDVQLLYPQDFHREVERNFRYIKGSIEIIGLREYFPQEAKLIKELWKSYFGVVSYLKELNINIGIYNEGFPNRKIPQIETFLLE